jgi:integrase
MSEDLKTYIKDKRSTLSEGSLKTYTSILKSLHKKIWGGEINVKDFDDTKKVLEFLKELPANKRKTLLSALVVITDDAAYRKQMMEDVSDYNKEINKQQKTETQKENWVSTEEVKVIYDMFKKNADLLYKKSSHTANELQQIQNFIILALMSGIFIAPRRSLDYCEFKIRNIDKKTDNYLDKNTLVFNRYKTAKTYGQQSVSIPVQLRNILTKWSKLNPTDYLLIDTNGNKLNSVKLNQRFNSIFGDKKIATNALRHTYLTDKYAETSKKQKQLEADLTEMGSSMNVSKNYIKID